MNDFESLDNLNTENNKTKKAGGSDILNDLLKVDILVFIATLIKWKNLIKLAVIPSIIVVILAITVVFTIKSSWQSTCILSRQAEDDTPKNLSVSFNFPPIDMDIIMELIRSRENVERVIKKLKLPCSIKQFYSITDVTKNEEGTIINISATGKTAEQSATIANTLAKIFLKSYIDMRTKTVIDKKKNLTATAKELDVKINTLENQKSTLLKDNNVYSLKDDIVSKYEQLNELENTWHNNIFNVAKSKIQIECLEKAIKEMKPDVKVSYEKPYANTEKLDEKKEQLNILRQKYTKENPKVIRMEEEVRWLQAFIENHIPKGEQKVTYGINSLRQDINLKLINERTYYNSTKYNVTTIENSIKKTRKEIGNLIKLRKKIDEIDNALNVNYNVINDIRTLIAGYDAILNTKNSNVAILEPAFPPIFPEPTKKKIIVLAGGVLSFLVTLVVILLVEFLDFSIKSKIDITDICGVNYIGMLPDMHNIDKTKYSLAQQTVIGNLVSEFKTNEQNMIFFGSYDKKVGKSFIIDKLNSYLISIGKKVLYIEAISEASKDIKDNIINSYLYRNNQLANIKVNCIKGNNLHKLYFHVDEETLKTPIERERLTNMFSSFNKDKYDVIIFEMPDFKTNKFLFTTISYFADKIIFIGKFKNSSKFGLKSCYSSLNEHKVSAESYGIINMVETHYYKFLS